MSALPAPGAAPLASTPISERENEFTTAIDLASPVEIVRLLRQSDAQLFSGYLNHAGVFDDEIIGSIVEAALGLLRILNENHANPFSASPTTTSTTPGDSVATDVRHPFSTSADETLRKLQRFNTFPAKLRTGTNNNGPGNAGAHAAPKRDPPVAVGGISASVRRIGTVDGTSLGSNGSGTGSEAADDSDFEDDMDAFMCSRQTSMAREHDACVVLSGSGTSGRLGYFCAAKFNRILHHFNIKPVFSYLASGHDKSLVISQESAEDRPDFGVRDLQEVIGTTEDPARHRMLIGITCGLSAPYVAGQLHYTMGRSDFTSVLLGFNPPALARNLRIENWPFTFHDIVREMLEKREAEQIKLRTQGTASSSSQSSTATGSSLGVPPSTPSKSSAGNFHAGENGDDVCIRTSIDYSPSLVVRQTAHSVHPAPEWFFTDKASTLKAARSTTGGLLSSTDIIAPIGSYEIVAGGDPRSPTAAAPIRPSVRTATGSIHQQPFAQPHPINHGTNHSHQQQQQQQQNTSQSLQSRFVLITPVIGPEPVTGSTRMKGGTMTKILLEVIFFTALAAKLRTAISWSAWRVTFTALDTFATDVESTKIHAPSPLSTGPVASGSAGSPHRNVVPTFESHTSFRSTSTAASSNTIRTTLSTSAGSTAASSSGGRSGHSELSAAVVSNRITGLDATTISLRGASLKDDDTDYSVGGDDYADDEDNASDDRESRSSQQFNRAQNDADYERHSMALQIPNNSRKSGSSNPSSAKSSYEDSASSGPGGQFKLRPGRSTTLSIDPSLGQGINGAPPSRSPILSPQLPSILSANYAVDDIPQTLMSPGAFPYQKDCEIAYWAFDERFALGAFLHLVEEHPSVYKVQEASLASYLGLRENDEIRGINGLSTSKWTSERVRMHIRSAFQDHRMVVLSIFRPSESLSRRFAEAAEGIAPMLDETNASDQFHVVIRKDAWLDPVPPLHFTPHQSVDGSIVSGPIFPPIAKIMSEDIRFQLNQYQNTITTAYQSMTALVPIIQTAGASLRAHRHIYYVGACTMGVLAFIDASECPPTFGANIEDIRGFIHHGWRAWSNREGSLRFHGRVFQFSLSDFVKEYIPSLTPHDTIVFLFDDTNINSPGTCQFGCYRQTKRNYHRRILDVLSAIQTIPSDFRPGLFAVQIRTGAHQSMLPYSFSTVDQSPHSVTSDHMIFNVHARYRDLFREIVRIDIPIASMTLAVLGRYMPASFWLSSWAQALVPPCSMISSPLSHAEIARGNNSCPMPSDRFSFPDICFAEIALKLVLNTISTGAHILKGMVYRNRMINVRLSNTKLFYRAIQIVRDITGCSDSVGLSSVLRAIYRRDIVSPEIANVQVSQHIAAASQVQRVVSVAALLASGRAATCAEADAMLNAEPVIRNVLALQ